MTLMYRLKNRSTARLARWAVSLGIALSLSVAVWGCSNGVVSPEQADAGNAADDGSAQIADSSAPTDADRAAWEAQMAKIESVLGSMDRAELIGESSTKGPLEAEIVLLKFSDFQCPYCAVAAADMKTFTQAHESDVLYVYKQFPLVSIHPEAMPAAKAAWAAGQQDQFWLYHDGLFAFQERLGEDYYVELAEQIKLDMEKFNRDRNSPEAQAAIDQDIALARALELRGTPTFVMNELLIPGGAPLTFFEEAVTRLKAQSAAR